ncbi:MAG: phosphatase PAP2 family protein [Ilumatobacteraceae bacterium]
MNRYPTIDGHARPVRSGASRAGHLGVRFSGELLLMGAVFVVYRQIRFLTRNDTEGAMANARRVVDFEQQLHVFSERGVQDLVMHSQTLVAFLNRYYVTVHFPLTIAFLVWVFWRHHDAYRRIRNVFVSVTVAALAIHVAFPLAPPRMLDGSGFVDTLQLYGPRIYSTDTSESIANQFAAMPSLHFGWAAIVAGAYVSIRGTRRSLWMVLHPAITLLAIVATANHYWLDAAVALVLVVVAAAALRAMTYRRQVVAVPSLATLRPLRTPVTVGGWSDGLASNDPVPSAIRARECSRPAHHGSQLDELTPARQRVLVDQAC